MSDYRPKIEQRLAQQIVQGALLLAIALIETSLAPTIWRFRVNWVLVFVIGWTLLRGLYPGLGWAIYGGLALDMLTPEPVGSHVLALAVCVITLALLTEALDRDQLLLIILGTVGASLVYSTLLLIVHRYTSGALPWASYVMIAIVPTAILDTIGAIPTIALLRRFVRRGRPALSEF